MKKKDPEFFKDCLGKLPKTVDLASALFGRLAPVYFPVYKNEGLVLLPIVGCFHTTAPIFNSIAPAITIKCFLQRFHGIRC
ncbi:MAG: hypothetical protein WAT19_12910 [Ferruginibacter sp.]